MYYVSGEYKDVIYDIHIPRVTIKMILLVMWMKVMICDECVQNNDGNDGG